MPYPVLPPALPPLVNVVLPEGSDRSSPNPETTLQNPARTQAANRAAAQVAACPQGCGSPEPTAEPVSKAELLEAAATAGPLGQPVTVGLPQARTALPLPIEPLLPQAAGTGAPTTFLQVPDLDALMAARRQRIGQHARPLASTRTAADPAPESPLAQSTSQPAPEPEPEQPQDSIRLDLPTESNPATPEQPSDTLEPAPSQTLPQTPQPSLPNPTEGEVLTIPTPSRGRQEDSDQPEEAPRPARGRNAPPEADSSPADSVPVDPQAVGEVLEVRGDRQEFNERQQVFSADGNVEVRFRRGVLTADRVRVNIPNRVAVAEGNAVLSRGDQVLRGERFSYNFGTNQGNIETARGELLIPAAQRDLNPDPSIGTSALDRPVTERVSSAQPLQVLGGVPGPAFGIGNSQQAGTLTRLRFEADRAEFEGDGLVAENVRITNDPFSPPELELRSNRVTYTRLSPTQAEIRARNPRLVFDQGFTLPLLVNRLVLDNRRRNSGLLNFGYDEKDRDGFYIERSFDLYSSPLVSFTVTPQILVQRAIDQGDFPSADQFGLVAEADFQFTPTTTARAVANFSSLDFSEVDDSLRASLRLQQQVLNHTVSLEYSYRDRLFNGSLGFQDIQSSVGVVVASPRYVLGDSLINLNYIASVQYVNAQTDQNDLYNSTFPDSLDRDLSCIDPDDRDTTGNGCADLTRYQAALLLNRLFFLWFGKPLPATPTEGLRYTPTPVVPYVGINLDARGIYSAYSNGDTQASLRGGISLLGQFGHFSKPFLDYTAFSFGYYNTLRNGESPFLFDRVSDDEFVILSLTQQIYGPLRFGVQFSYNLQTQDEIDTIYSLEYSRRTYSISASYSTGRSSATLTFRLNDFNWTGDPGPFSGLGSSTVESGLIRGIN